MHRAGLTVLAAVAAVAALVLAGCGDDPEPAAPASHAHEESEGHSHEAPESEPAEPESAGVTFTVAGGKRTKGPAELEVKQGEQVVLVVTADAPDELHVHGYDKTAKLEPGKPTTLRFTADLAGVWEIELHEGGGLLLELRVSG